MVYLKGHWHGFFDPCFLAHLNHPKPLVYPRNFFQIYLQIFKVIQTPRECAPPCNKTPREYAPPGNQTPWEEHTPGDRLPGSMLLPGIKPKISNPFAECTFEKFASPGGAYSRGVDLPGVCSSWGVGLPKRSLLPGSTPREKHTPGNQTPQEGHTPGNQTPREEHTPGNQTPREYAPPGDLWTLPGVTLKLPIFSKTNYSPKVIKQVQFSFYVFVYQKWKKC